MKTFKQFQEDYNRVINPVKPVTDLIGASLGAYELGKKAFSGLSNIFQARKKGKFQRKKMEGRVGENQKIKPKLLDAVRKKQREIEGNVDDKLNTPTDIVDFTGKNVDKKTLEKMNKRVDQFNSYDPLQEEAPTNNVGDGSNVSLPPSYIPGMRKRKNYAKGGRNSRKPWLDYLKNK